MAYCYREPSRSGNATDYRGARRVCSFTVQAASEEHALTRLVQEQGVAQGTVYINDAGVSPDPLCLCQSFAFETLVAPPTNGEGLYRITAEYGRNTIARPGTRAVDGNPVYRIDRQTISEPVDHDVHGNPIVNTAGVPIQGLTRIRIDKTLVVEWISKHASWVLALNVWGAYEGYVNDGVFAGAPAGCLLCRQVDVTPATDIPRPPAETLYPYRIVAQLAFRPMQYYPQAYPDAPIGGWVDVTVNKGRSERVFDQQTQSYKQRVILDENEIPISEDVLLDTDGLRLSPGARPWLIRTEHYPARSFAGIPEPQ